MDLPYGFPAPLLELDQWSIVTQRGLTCPDHGNGCNDCKRYFGHLPPPGREPQFESALKEAITVRQRAEYEHFRRFEKGEEDKRFQEYEQQAHRYEQWIQGYEEKIRDLEESMEERSAKFARERKYGERYRTERQQAWEKIDHLEKELGIARQRIKVLEHGQATDQMGNLHRGESRSGSYAQASSGQSQATTDNRPVTNKTLRPEAMQRSTSGQKRTRSHYEETAPLRGEPLETVNSERSLQPKGQPRVRLPGPSHERKEGPSHARGTEAILVEPALKKKRTIPTMTVTTKPRPLIALKGCSNTPPLAAAGLSTSGIRELMAEERDDMELDDIANRPLYEPGVNKGWESQSDEWDEEEREPVKDWDVNKVVQGKTRAHNRRILQTGERPENMVITVDSNVRPQDSSVHECDKWFNFVPDTEDQAWCLMNEATNEQAGALARVKHLIWQLDTNKDLFIIKGMATIKWNWRNPGKRAMKSGPIAGTSQAGGSGSQATTKELEEGNKVGMPAATSSTSLLQPATTAAVEEALPPLEKPGSMASAEEWFSYYKRCRNPTKDIPVYIRTDAEGTPIFDDVKAHAIMEHTVPQCLSPYSIVCYRRQFTTLFAVPGLYGALVKHSGAQLKPEGARSVAFPEDFDAAKLDVPTVAVWLKENGLADDDVPYLEKIGPKARQDLDDKAMSRQEEWLTHPRTLKQCRKKYQINEENTTNTATKSKPLGTRSVKGKETTKVGVR